jgi:hypothetical protein
MYIRKHIMYVCKETHNVCMYVCMYVCKHRLPLETLRIKQHSMMHCGLLIKQNTVQYVSTL